MWNLSKNGPFVQKVFVPLKHQILLRAYWSSHVTRLLRTCLMMSTYLNHILSQQRIQTPYELQGLEIAFQTKE